MLNTRNAREHINRVQRELREQHSIEVQESHAGIAREASINVLGLSGRMYNLFLRAGIDRLYELVQKTEKDLLAIHNFGPKALEEVVNKLEAQGLKLKTDQEEVSKQ